MLGPRVSAGNLSCFENAFSFVGGAAHRMDNSRKTTPWTGASYVDGKNRGEQGHRGSAVGGGRLGLGPIWSHLYCWRLRHWARHAAAHGERNEQFGAGNRYL